MSTADVPAAPTLFASLNTRWHKRALQILMVVVLGHWGEHLLQAFQIYVLGWDRAKALGMLGLFYPWLVKSETLHYGYALIMLVGIWSLRKGFTGLSLRWWSAALIIQFWHHIEHAVLQYQALTGHCWFRSPVPVSFLQLVFPRVELHLFYNAVVFIPMVVAMYLHVFPAVGDSRAPCTCAWRRDHLATAHA